MTEPFDHHSALERLKFVLEAAGFRVKKKPRTHTTLQVYLEGQPYPLLNPRFYPAVGQLTGDLVITVLSRGDAPRASIDQQLAAMASTPDCSFIPAPAAYRDYYIHGSFELPLKFVEAGAPDFTALQQPLCMLRLALEGA